MNGPNTTYCACGCNTVVMRDSTPTTPLTDRYCYDSTGELDYIELYVAGHDRRGLTSAFRSRPGKADGSSPMPWGRV